MTFWNLYFIFKLYLYAAGHLQPVWTANIALALALAVTSPIRGRLPRAVRNVVALALAVPLIYHEAIVPPFSRIVEMRLSQKASSPILPSVSQSTEERTRSGRSA